MTNNALVEYLDRTDDPLYQRYLDVNLPRTPVSVRHVTVSFVKRPESTPRLVGGSDIESD